MISAALFLPSVTLAAAGGPAPSLESRLNEIARQELATREGAGVAIGIIHAGERTTFFYGEKAKGSGHKPDGATLFQIGSITKTFVATLLADYVNKGKVRLDDPLSEYLPAVHVPSFNGRRITLLDLATHTSGLPRSLGRWRRDQASVNDMFQFVGSLRLSRAPGQKYEYSNLGFALLVEALAHAGGNDWAALVHEEVAAPLQLNDTVVEPSGSQLDRRAQGYDPKGQPAPWRSNVFPAMSGAGGLYSTMDDMLKYLAFNMGETDTPLKQLLIILHQSRRPAGIAPNQMALGWHLRPASKGRIVWKNGGTPGFRSYIGFNPATKVGLVVLTNSQMKPAPFVQAIFAHYGVIAEGTRTNPLQPAAQESEEDQP